MTILQGPAPPTSGPAPPFCPQMPWDPALPILSASRATSSLKSQHYPLTFPSAPSTAVPCAFGWAHPLLLHLGLKAPSDVPGQESSQSWECHTCWRRVQLTLGNRRDAQEPCRAILGRVPAPAAFSCPFWLAATAGWKNSAGMGRSALEASGEKGLGGAAGEGEEGAGEQAQAPEGGWQERAT